MPLQPFSLGNTLQQAEQINALRDRRNPNSLPNRLMEAQIGAYEAKAQNPLGAATYGKSPFMVRDEKGNITAWQLSDQGGAKQIAFPSGAMPAVKGSWRDMGGGLQFLEEYGPGNPPPDTAPPVATGTQGSAIGTQGTAIGTQGTATGFIPKTLSPENLPENVAAREAAKLEAQRASEQTDPTAIAASQTRLADNQGVITTIDSLLKDRGDGKSFIHYAYGRENVLTPDNVKPQSWIDAEAERDRVVANLQLENVKKLKGTGPITENEQKILKDAASILGNPRISPALAEKELKRVRTMFSKWAKDNEAAIKAGTLDPNWNRVDEEYEQLLKELYPDG